MSGNLLPLITQRVLNRPLLIHPQMADALYAILDGRIAPDAFDAAGKTASPAPGASRFIGSYDRPDGAGRRRYTRAAGRTALITVDGSLVNRGAWVGADFCTGLVSYEGIAAQIDEVAADARAGHIDNLVIDMNSYGGEATGMAGLSAKIRGLRKTMHVVAVVNDVAASAGYGIVVAADRIVISPTSIVGSIGVVMMHLDRSGELSQKGIRPTLIHAGAKKVDGNPFGPLPENVRADMTKDVLAFYDQFLSVVEAGRGKARLSAKKARETEADVFIGQEAIDAGLADAIGSLDDVLAELSRPVRAAGKSNHRSNAKMEREDLPSAQAGMVSQTALQAAITKAEADGKTVGIVEGKREGSAEGAKAERDRISAIVNSDAGKARPNAALALALAPDSPSAETAIKLLGTMPEEAAPAASAKPSVPPLSERAKEGAEVGASGTAPGGSAVAPEAVKKGWANAFARVAG